MKILALESSGLAASVAVVEDDQLLAEYTTNYKKTHSQTLLPMLDEVKKMIELDLASLDAIAVSAGPGSFTGLRIGSATAKGLGLALHKPLIAVPTVDALAMNLYGAAGVICPLMDARRSQVYTGAYRFVMTEDGYRLHILKEQCAVDIEEIAGWINAYLHEESEQLSERKNIPVLFLGDGVPVFRERLKELIQSTCVFAPAGSNCQTASSVAVLALQYAKEGHNVMNADDFVPEYLRPSQAERERKEAVAAAGEEKADAMLRRGQTLTGMTGHGD